MAEYLKAEQVEELLAAFSTVAERREKIVWSYTTFDFSNEIASEYARHGVARRFSLLNVAIAEIYRLLPPDQTNVPQQDIVEKATINIQSFIINIYGILENLAFVWAHERSITKQDGQPFSNYEIGFTKREFRNTLPSLIIQNLEQSTEWHKNLESYRHSLAHRIPLYIPPFNIDPRNLDRYNEIEISARTALKDHKFDKYTELKREQESYRFFRPWITHSFSENSRPIVFHGQMLADFATVELYAQQIIDALQR